MRPEYPDFLWDTYVQWGCTEVVFIGDIVDWGAIKFHPKHPGQDSFEVERDRARGQVAQLYKRFPKAHWMIGNHDCLPSRQAASVGLGDGLLKSYQEYWGVPGWTTHARFEKLDIDGTLYMHGDRGRMGMQAAWKNARDLFRNVVQGHCHTEMGVWYWVNDDFRVFGMNVGTGVDDKTLAMLYNKSQNRRSALGCGVVIDGVEPHVEALQLGSNYERK